MVLVLADVIVGRSETDVRTVSYYDYIQLRVCKTESRIQIASYPSLATSTVVQEVDRRPVH